MSFATSEIGWGISSDDLVSTRDGGANWRVQLSASERKSDFKNIRVRDGYSKVVALTESEVFAIGNSKFVYSTDSGSHWEVVEFKNTITRDFAFRDRSQGWLTGEERSLENMEWTSVLYETEDGGRTWRKVNVRRPNPFETGTWWTVYFGPNETLWMIGDESLRSSDVGQTWQSAKFCEGIYGVPIQIGFYGTCGWIRTNQGETFCTTQDGGTTWTSVEFPPMKGGVAGVLQTDESNLWAYGKDGVYQSKDNGQTWEKVLNGEFTTGQIMETPKQLILAGTKIVQIPLS